MLNNIRYICPPLATYIRNCYIAPSRLFVTGGKEIKSSEGTTQGDPPRNASLRGRNNTTAPSPQQYQP